MTPAVFQHGRGDLALFLHVLGATTLFGAVVVLVTLAIAARRSADPQPTARVLFRVWLFVLSGFVPLVRVGVGSESTPTPLAAGLLLPLATGSGVAVNATPLISIAWFFTQAGALVFGSGLAVLAVLALMIWKPS